MNYSLLKKSPIYFIFSSLFMLSIGFYSGQATAQENFNVLSNWIDFPNTSHSIYHHLAQTAYHQLAERKEKVGKIKTLAAWQERQRLVREELQRAVGPFPQKTSLNPVITKKISKNGYHIENIIFESQPHFYVTSSLFIPEHLNGSAPAIIYCSGHTDLGYRNPTYQHEIINLVNKGFIVFAFDPIGQGERQQYWDPVKKKSSVGGPTHEHSYPGAQVFLNGSSLAKYMIWDGIRAVDYLLTREEVDSSRIGITGRSGGGTQSAYIAAFDPRIYAAAPENYVTNFTRLIQEKGPQDAEQNFYHSIKNGLDHPDLLEVRAPKPVLMVTTTRDIFSIQGVRETEQEVKKIYQAYRKEGQFLRTEDDTVHASTIRNREAIYSFFQNFLKNPGSNKDEEVDLLDQELQVTRTGQVVTSFDEAETIYSLNKKEADNRLKKNLLHPQNKENIIRSAANLSGYRNSMESSVPIFTGRFSYKDYSVERYFFHVGKDYVIPYLLIRPSETNGKLVVCLNPNGKGEEMNQETSIELAYKGFTICLPDLPNIGELADDRYKGDSYIKNNSYGLWYLGVLTGESIVGEQASVLSQLVKTLKASFSFNEIYGLAKGTLCSTLIHAAALGDYFNGIALEHPLTSFSSVVDNRDYSPDFIQSLVAGSIGDYDLPHLITTLTSQNTLIISPLNGRGHPLSEKEFTNYSEELQTKVNQPLAPNLTLLNHPETSLVSLFINKVVQ